LAAIAPFGFALWTIGAWVALLGTAILLVFRTGIVGAVLVALLAPAIGEQLAAGNVASFFPALLAYAWCVRGGSGVALGLMAALKLSPVTMSAWLIGTRSWRQAALFGITIVIAVAMSALFAGVDNLGSYLAVARQTGASHLSLSGFLGIPWASYAALTFGYLLAILAAQRSSGLSFVIAIIASVFGTPALYVSGLVTLMGVLIPLAFPDRGGATAIHSHSVGASSETPGQASNPTSALMDQA
jgi:hypothetical protein